MFGRARWHRERGVTAIQLCVALAGTDFTVLAMMESRASDFNADKHWR